MTVFFMDSFDDYTTITDKWTTSAPGSGSIAPGAGGRFSTNGLVITSAGFQNPTLTKQFTGTSTIIAGFALKTTQSGGSNHPTIHLRESGTSHLYIEIDRTTKELRLYHGNGTLLDTGPTIDTGYHYFEFKANIHDSTGSCEVRMDEAVIMDVSGTDTRNGGTGVVNQFTIMMQDVSGTMIFDDLYLDNGTTYQGDCRVEAKLPDGDGNYSQWDGSDGNQVNNYLLVDESTPNNETDYVYTATANDIDTYTITNLTTTAGTVKAVQYNFVARKDDAGARVIAPIVRISTTDYQGTSRNLSTDYVRYLEIVTQSPATASAWTIAEINGMQYGVKMVS